MNLASELQKILGGKPKPVSGTVISTSPTEISVRTRSGVKVVPRTDATAYKVGDSVRLRDGMLSGRINKGADLPEYFV